ncbi:MAG: hypothetical protein AAFN77_08545 [Planctomycetota bacterium]
MLFDVADLKIEVGTEGKLTVAALQDVYLRENAGDLTLVSVVSGGMVSLEAPDGSILDGISKI